MKNQKKSGQNRRAPSAGEKRTLTNAIAQRYRGALARLANSEIAPELDAQEKVIAKYKSAFKRLAKS